MSQTRFAILGTGYGASVYIPALVNAGQKITVVVCRSKREGIGFEQTDDWRQAILRADVDAVVVALPPGLQRAAVEAVIAAKKPFICEKPCGVDLADASAMHESASRLDLPHAVGFQFRFEPGIQALRQAMREGRIGQLERIEVDWCVCAPHARTRSWSWRNDIKLGGGVALNFAVHVLDYLRWMSGGDVRMLAQQERIIVHSRKDNSGQDITVTAPDSYDALLAISDRAIASVRVCNLVQKPLGHHIVVRGSAGTLEFLHKPPFSADDLELTQHTDQRGSAPLHPGSIGGQTKHIDSRVTAASVLVEGFLAKLAGQEQPDLPTLSDALAVHQLLATSGRILHPRESALG